ncbi:Ataxin-7-like protein 1 [Astathelohania contejeani]|uniref:Ataxin-7-like protein 1 n=1 Tax=Astathelohania contejeani TaxID=164912 RepID=A0ABQ7HZ23_9MICR|nr:Ataxin-7-like protein 1 [Thelohania contejeani]
MTPFKNENENTDSYNPLIQCIKCNDIFYYTFCNDHYCFNNPTSIFEAKNNKRERKLKLDVHCAVVDTATNMPCYKLLTCRTHSIDEKNSVNGRSAPVTTLLKRQAAKKSKLKINREKENKNTKINEIMESKIDENILQSIANIRPVVNKVWFDPQKRYKEMKIKSMFYNKLNIQLNITKKQSKL